MTTQLAHAIETEREIRGFALYVGLTEDKIEHDAQVSDIVRQIKDLVALLAPEAETHATVALAPATSGGRDLEVVRRALGDPSHHVAREIHADPVLDRAEVVTIDISRKQVLLDGIPAQLTYKEFELLQFFVLREGFTVSREQIVEGLWADAPETEKPSARTIDVHVRRLRVKLGKYQGIVRTVRGSGYRFDRHADVQIVQTGTPSPDSF